jgi:hypothetical protein
MSAPPGRGDFSSIANGYKKTGLVSFDFVI